MAVIGKIRNRMGVLMIVFVGMALLAFILGDLLTSGAYFFNSEQNTVGIMGGEEIKADRYSVDLENLERYYQQLNPEMEFTEEVRKSIEEQLWGEYQYKYVYAPRLAELGISVSDEELKDAFSGVFIDQNVRQQFTDPATGMFNYQALEQTINMFIDESSVPEDQLAEWEMQRKQWRTFEDQVAQNRALTKYTTLIEKGIQVTSTELKNQFVNDGTTFSFRFVAKNYFEIPDSSVVLDDADYKASYAKYKHLFKSSEAVRYVKYGVFRIVPSAADSAQALASVSELKEEFITNENALYFVNEHSDIRREPGYYKKGMLISAIDSLAFQAATGSVFGPYLDGSSYVLAKKTGERMLPDSARARMVFIASMDANGAEMPNASAKADSIFALAKGGVSVKQLAAEYNDDPALKADSGFVQAGGWITWDMIAQAPIFDSIFAMNTGAIDMVSLPSGFAIVHVEAKTSASKQVEMAFVHKEIHSEDGQGIAFGQANEFIAEAKTPEDFDRLQKTGKYLIREDLLRESGTGLTGIDNSRKMVYWAFSNEKGKVGDLELLGNNYVVAAVSNARKPGIPELSELKGDPSFENFAKRDKKGITLSEQLKSAMGSGKIEDLASQMNTAVMSSGVVNMNSYSVAGLGNDAAVLGYAAGAPSGKLAGPVIGRGGVYVLVVDSKTVGTAPPVFDGAMKRQFASMLVQQAMNSLQTVLLSDAHARDMRYKLYQ